jgi:predicted cupin superfamily sugar epimerase
LNIKSIKEYTSFWRHKKLPVNLPAKPYNSYKNDGWISVGDFLGTNRESNIGRTYKSFDDAKSFLKKLKLKSRKYWTDYCNKMGKPNDLPINLEKIYSKDSKWKGIGDFLGNGFVSTNLREYLTYEESRGIVRKLNLKNQKEWNIYRKTKKPESIPSTPNIVYKDKGWKDWGAFLGTDIKSNSKKEFYTYKKAQSIVRKLKLKNQKEWNIYRKTIKLEKIPSNPNSVYNGKGWKDWADFLGTDNKSNSKKKYLIYEEAQSIISKLKLKNQKEWNIYRKTKKPENIPSNPNIVYKDKGWISLGIWLGTDTIAPQKMIFKDFEEARAFVHKLKLKNNLEWKKYIALNNYPLDIPRAPDSSYKNKGWKGWADFLGKEINK